MKSKDKDKELPETPVENEQPDTEKLEEQLEETQDDSEADKVQELGEKLAELNDKYVRLYSEYENYRKRTMGEKAELILNGGKDIIKAVLPVVDDMERALQAMSDGDNAKEGVELIYNKLLKILQQKGLKEIAAMGEKFSEEVHEAVTKFPATDQSQKGMVVDVIEKGYYLNDKVLRYAKVVVAI
ncbi:MAG: nucleotide exchange factor GrpE [Bacteroidales bacterium]|nr:nucleotide exchange factor GrpE [Bacteroidales bacterium]